MDHQIEDFHENVAKVSNRWNHHNRTTLFVTKPGDTLPVGLVIPVTLDCFTDGFLIGVSCALSPPAGIILGQLL